MSMKFQVTLNISAEKAWVAVGEKFGATGQWTSALDSSHMQGDLAIGGRRVCVRKNKSLVEQLTAFDPEKMYLAYVLTIGRPVFVKSAHNTWQVEALGSDRSIVTMRPDIRLKWWAVLLKPLMAAGLRVSLTKIMEEFAHWAETGDVHPRKKQNNTRLNA